MPDPKPARSAGPAGSEPAAVAVFTALADPSRRAILDALARTGPATVSDLARVLPITRQGVAKHLALLVDAGLVAADEPEGRRVRYRVQPAPVRAALAWLQALANQWDDRLGALQAHLSNEQGISGRAARVPPRSGKRVDDRGGGGVPPA